MRMWCPPIDHHPAVDRRLTCWSIARATGLIVGASNNSSMSSSTPNTHAAFARNHLTASEAFACRCREVGRAARLGRLDRGVAARGELGVARQLRLAASAATRV
jgi:hypothetical protein